jgi:hypothetical protein
MQEIYSWPWVEAEAVRTAEAWRSCAAMPLPRGLHYGPHEQRNREKAYDNAMRAVQREIRKAPQTVIGRLATRNRLVALFGQFAVAALGLEDQAVELITSDFLPAGIEFARWARRFDAQLSMASIIQACRNAWTGCGLQPLLGEHFEITPSIVGYSLLYPYTDNYLDSHDESGAAKRRFCARFRERLRDGPLPAEDDREVPVWALVGLIEGQYPRDRYPQVFDSLLAIHQAQEESIAQLGSDGFCSNAEVLRISCAKGGSSVLADACLARGWLSAEESRLAFDWGALLQLGDDLQDVAEDLRRGSATLFTRAAAAGRPLDSLVIQLLNFSECVGAEMNRFPNGSATLKDLLRTSWRSLIVGAVANAREFFSPGFLAEMESSSPFRFGFLDARRRKVTSRNGMYQAVFNTLIESPEDEAGTRPEPGCQCTVPSATYSI